MCSVVYNLLLREQLTIVEFDNEGMIHFCENVSFHFRSHSVPHLQCIEIKQRDKKTCECFNSLILIHSLGKNNTSAQCIAKCRTWDYVYWFMFILIFNHIDFLKCIKIIWRICDPCIIYLGHYQIWLNQLLAIGLTGLFDHK